MKIRFDRLLEFLEKSLIASVITVTCAMWGLMFVFLSPVLLTCLTIDAILGGSND